MNHRDKVLIAGVVSELRERPLKSGNGRMAFVSLEDLSGTAELLCFSKVYAVAEEPLKSDDPLLVEATVQHEGEADSRSVKLRAERVRTLAEVREETTERIRLRLPADLVGPAFLDRLRHAVAPAPGDGGGGLPVELALVFAGEGEAVITLGAGFRMSPSDDAVERVERVAGAGCVAFL